MKDFCIVGSGISGSTIAKLLSKKYFPEMGIDVSWYTKKLTQNISSENNNLASLDEVVKKCKKCNLPETNETIVFEGEACNLCNSSQDYNQKINWEERKNRLLEMQ